MNQKENIQYIGIYKWDIENPTRISEIFNTFNFSIFIRSSVNQLCSSITRYLVKSCPPNTRKNIICTEKLDYSYFTNNHKIFINTNNNNISCAIITLNDFPNQSLLNITNNIENIINSTKDNINIKLDDILINNDKISSINENLSEIKDIMVENISNMLSKGEKLDTLIDKAEQLEMNSMKFHHGSKSLNSCCLIL